MIMEAERSTKTLDILIKSTQQRHLKRNMTKNVLKEKSIVNDGIEIEESMDIENYQVAGVHNINSSSIAKLEEDSPRRIPPTPEPVGKPEKRRVPSQIRESYKVTNPQYQEERKQDMILVQNEFSEKEEANEVEDPKRVKNQKSKKKSPPKGTFGYPFKKEGSALMNTLDEVTKQAKMRVI